MHKHEFLHRWGTQTAFECTDPSDASTDAHLAYANSMAGYVGCMCMGIAFSRFQWGLDNLAGWPKRSVLCMSPHRRFAAEQELLSHWHATEEMRASGS